MERQAREPHATPVQDLARQRRIDTLVGFLWYTFSAMVLALMTSGTSALAAIRGMEVWGAWVGRFAVLPALGTLAGLAWVVRHSWAARARVDTVFPPRIPQVEPLAVFGTVVIVGTLGWVARPVLDPVTFCIALLLLTSPLVWIGVRAPSRSTRWVWGIVVLNLAAAGVLVWLEITYGPLSKASDAALLRIVEGVVGLALAGVVAAFGLLAVLGRGFWVANRLYDQGELQAVSELSYAGLLEDSPLVLDALRLTGRSEEAEARFHRFAAVLPLAGPLHVLVQILADREDTERSETLARALLEAYPMSPVALATFARVFRRSSPAEALDAVVAAQTHGLFGSSRTPVLQALEVCALAHLGQRAAARTKLYALEFGDHPVHSEEARLYAAEAHVLWDEAEAADTVLEPIHKVPEYIRRAQALIDMSTPPATEEVEL